ncbi:MAG: cation:proton antiporter [Verrucomicrobiota bacterium]
MLAVLEDVQFIQDLAVVLLAAGLFGWLAKSIGLSSVVGYLIGGVLLSPHNLTDQLISDEHSIHTLAQIGLIFLLFHIGLDFSIRKLKRIGLHLIVANTIAAIIIFSVFSSTGVLFGWDEASCIFLGAMFMISSSAIILKVLKEQGISHEKPSQTAMGLVIIEDALVVILLAVLAAYVQFDDLSSAPLTSTVGVLGTFILLLLLIGFFIVPKFLTVVRKETNTELTVIIVCALVFCVSVLSVKAGYSLALGAFLLGAVIADTPIKGKLDRWLTGVHSILTAIFFTAIGMLIELELVPGVWKQIVLLSVLVLIFRFIGYCGGLLVAGTHINQSIRSGLIVTPVGEFSFVIAGLGVTSGAISEDFYPIAIGVCFITSFVSPLLTQNAERIASQMESKEPQWFRKIIAYYHDRLAWLGGVQDRSVLWNLSKKRLVQILRELGIITGIALFSRPLYHWIESRIGQDFLFTDGTLTLCFAAGIALAAAPLLSLYRNIAAISLVYAEALTQKSSSFADQVLRQALATLFKGVLVLLCLLWMMAIVPFNALTIYALATILIAFLVLVFGLRRKLILLHSRFEISLEEALGTEYLRSDQKLNYLLDPHQEWELEIIECEVPDDSPHSGKPLKDLQFRTRFGASIVGIDRHGFIIGNPTATNRLFPGDRILLLGTLEQIKAARLFLGERIFSEHQADFDDITLDQLRVPANCKVCGCNLASLKLPERFQIQLLGMRRDGKTALNLQGDAALRDGDLILVLGAPDKIKEFRRFLRDSTKADETA